MNPFVSRLCSKTSLAIGLYISAMVSLGFLAHAQLTAMQLMQSGRPVSVSP
ncbi:hypothetical protein [Acaryochloris sp. IP29b_bin.137]|uniref:hypothetical protein n=1 Tax=Acaryochloris sp. IP29b_bin.137 TaxID=2969217 RepID=UPI002616D62A|nr:hypothetical protein [Acaryochloris sp. IP29b_bin.137]